MSKAVTVAGEVQGLIDTGLRFVEEKPPLRCCYLVHAEADLRARSSIV
jgi:hypothetical protein